MVTLQEEKKSTDGERENLTRVPNKARQGQFYLVLFSELGDSNAKKRYYWGRYTKLQQLYWAILLSSKYSKKSGFVVTESAEKPEILPSSTDSLKSEIRRNSEEFSVLVRYYTYRMNKLLTHTKIMLFFLWLQFGGLFICRWCCCIQMGHKRLFFFLL